MSSPLFANNSITTNKIPTATLLAPMFMTGAVLGGTIAPNAVTFIHVANDAVTTPAIADDAVTRQEIAADAVGHAQVENVQLGNLSLKPGWTTTAQNPAHYVIDAEGVVHLRGLLLRADGAGTTAFQLPAGIRPEGQSDREIPLVGAGGTVDPDPLNIATSGCGGISRPVSAYIQGDGPPDAEGGVGFSPGACSYYHLDGISYVP